MLVKIKVFIAGLFPGHGRVYRFLRRAYMRIKRWNLRARFLIVQWAKKILFHHRDVKSIKLIKSADEMEVEFNDGRRFLHRHFTTPYDFFGFILNENIPYEKYATEILDYLIGPGDVVIDIGANFGWYSIKFGRLVGENGKVYCFEPMAEAFLDLQKNFALNFPGSQRLILEKMAIGDHAGKQTLFLPIHLGPAFAGADEGYWRHKSPSIPISVDVVSLDAYLTKSAIRKVDFIKCDAEGGEDLILAGAKNILSAANPPALCMEIGNEKNLKIIKILGEYGYNPFAAIDGKTLRKIDVNATELADQNTFFLQESHIASFRLRGGIFEGQPGFLP